MSDEVDPRTLADMGEEVLTGAEAALSDQEVAKLGRIISYLDSLADDEERPGFIRPSAEYDTTEKLERTDRGFRFTVESTRGTGTRDQDKVKAELRTEEMPSADECQSVVKEVQASMAEMRQFHPDGEDDDA